MSAGEALNNTVDQSTTAKDVHPLYHPPPPDVVNIRSTRVVLITDRHIAYLRARHMQVRCQAWKGGRAPAGMSTPTDCDHSLWRLQLVGHH